MKIASSMFRCAYVVASHSTLPPVGAVGKFLPFPKSISVNGLVPGWGRCCCFGSSSPYVVLKDRSYGNKQVISITPQLYEYILSNVREPEVKLCVLFLTFVSLACTMQCIYSSDLLVVYDFFLVADITATSRGNSLDAW